MPKTRKVEFELPEPDETPEIEVEPAVNMRETFPELEQRPLNMDDEPVEKEVKEEPKEAEEGKRVVKDGDAEIEVEDDTPPKDRGKTPSEPAPEPTPEELEAYGKNARNRIKHMTKTMHDERRRAEQAEREREEAFRYARQVLEENEKLQQTTSRSKNGMIAQAKKAVAAEVESAQREYKEAHESGDSDKLVEAQTKLSKAVAKQSRIETWRPEPLQQRDNRVQTQGQPVETSQPAPQRQPAQQADPKLQAWMNDNPWFGSNDEMTGYVYGVHNTLKRQGVRGDAPDYYERLDASVRKRFPEEFEDLTEEVEETKEEKKPTESVVAPVSRTPAPKRYKLTETQVAAARELGVPLERYAKQAAMLEMKERG